MKYISKKINKSVFQINRTIFSSASIDPIIRVPLIDTSDIENKGKKFRFLPIHPFPFSPLLYFYVSGVRARDLRGPIPSSKAHASGGYFTTTNGTKGCTLRLLGKRPFVVWVAPASC